MGGHGRSLKKLAAFVQVHNPVGPGMPAKRPEQATQFSQTQRKDSFPVAI